MPYQWRRTATAKATAARILKNNEQDKADAEAKAAAAKAKKEAKKDCKDGNCKPE